MLQARCLKMGKRRCIHETGKKKENYYVNLHSFEGDIMKRKWLNWENLNSMLTRTPKELSSLRPNLGKHSNPNGAF